MKIPGEWHRCEDGVLRPVLLAKVRAANGDLVGGRFLVDIGADQTVLSADFLAELNLPVRPPPSGFSLTGIGGQSTYVLVDSTIEFTRDDGGPASVKGAFAAVTTPVLEFSVLGRDVLANFDVIVSRPRNEIWLLAGRHQYQIVQV